MQLKKAVKEAYETKVRNAEWRDDFINKHEINIFELYDLLKEIKPIGKDNKVHTQDTLVSIKGSDPYYAALIFYLVPFHTAKELSKDDKLNFGPFVPKLMLAMKEARGIKYNAWSREQGANVRYALGHPLEGLLRVKPNVHWSKDKIIEMRKHFQYAGKVNTSSLKGAKTPEGKEFEETWGISVSPAMGCGYWSAVPGIILHWWQAHDSKRIPERMILDVYDWDKTPEPVEIIELKRSEESNDFVFDLPL